MQDDPESDSEIGPVPFEESVGFLVRDLNRAIQRELASLVQERGVVHGHWYFLRLLWLEDGLTQRELAQRLGMMEPTAVVALRGMEADGWIRRVRSTVDKRKVHILLTPAGLSLKPKLMPVAHFVNEHVLEGMTWEERSFFLGLLRRARSNFNSIQGDWVSDPPLLVAAMEKQLPSTRHPPANLPQVKKKISQPQKARANRRSAVV